MVPIEVAILAAFYYRYKFLSRLPECEKNMLLLPISHKSNR